MPRKEEGTLERREHVAVMALSNCRASRQAAASCSGEVLLACSHGLPASGLKEPTGTAVLPLTLMKEGATVSSLFRTQQQQPKPTQ